MKKDTFKSAHELNERIVALQEQLEKWEKSQKFESEVLIINEGEEWSPSLHVDTSFVPFPILKSVMVGTLNMELKELQTQFEAL